MSTDLTTYVTAAEYLAAERESPLRRSEWIDGEVRQMGGASFPHNFIVSNLVIALGAALRGQPFFVLFNDMKTRVPDGPYYYPDVVVTPDPPTAEDDHRDVVTNPVVVIEVLSPSTEAIDRREKLGNYFRIPSLTDCVLVAQTGCWVERYARGNDEPGEPTVLTSLDDVLAFESIGCELRLADVYDRVPGVE